MPFVRHTDASGRQVSLFMESDSAVEPNGFGSVSLLPSNSVPVTLLCDTPPLRGRIAGPIRPGVVGRVSDSGIASRKRCSVSPRDRFASETCPRRGALWAMTRTPVPTATVPASPGPAAIAPHCPENLPSASPRATARSSRPPLAPCEPPRATRPCAHVSSSTSCSRRRI